MRRLLLSVGLLLYSQVALASNVGFAINIDGGGGSDERSLAMASDSAGNIYVVGYFQGSVNFNPFGTSTTLTSTGANRSAFVTKYTSAGILVWAHRLLDDSNPFPYAVTVDTSNNVYVAGSYTNSGVFDPDGVAATITSSGAADIFVCKLDSTGALTWARSMGGSNNDEAYGIAVDSAGNVYTTGVYSGTADFDPGAGTFNLTSVSAAQDIFVSKLDSSGNFVWAKSMGGSGTDGGKSIAIDGSGNVYIVGYYQAFADVDFDPGPGVAFLPGSGGFLVTLDSSGNFVRVTAVEGYANTVASDALGNTWTAGSGFISKRDASGNLVWSDTSLASATVTSVAVDSSGNLYATGQFNSSINFDPHGVFLLTGTSSGNIFLLKLDNAGNFVFAWKMGNSSTQGEAPMGVGFDGSGDVFTAGFYFGPSDFDTGRNIVTFTSDNGADGFISKFVPAPIAAPQTLSVHSGNSLLIALTGTDVALHPLTTGFSVVTGPAHGGLTGSAPNLTYTPVAGFAGSDSFTFKINDGVNDSNIATVTINVTNNAPVSATQSVNAHTGTPKPITLSATDADSDPLTYSIVTQPAHGTLSGTPPNVSYTSNAYAGPDSFTFKANDGVADSNIATVTINVTDQLPQLSLTAVPVASIEGQSVAFNSGATDPEGDTLTYAWVFGDGGTSMAANPTYAYAAAGVYTATVTVTDISGATVSQSITINVYHDSDRPTARFVSSDLNGFVGQPVGFDASFSTDPLNNIVSYDWDFGDGSPHGSQQIISRVYAAEGTYTVTLTITDGRGLTDTTTLTMVILPAAQAGLLNPNIKYSVSWNRGATNADSLSLSATVNVGTTSVTQTSPLSLNVVGQTFTGASTTPLLLTRSSKSGAQVKWQIKKNTKKGTPKGTYAVKCTIKHASLGQAFALAGVTGTKSNTAKIPIRLGIGDSNFESSIGSQFRFGSSGAKASGGGSGPR